MKTTLRICEKQEAWTNCSTISPDERLFLNPMLPVAQNLQPILQPTCSKKKGRHLLYIEPTENWKGVSCNEEETASFIKIQFKEREEGKKPVMIYTKLILVRQDEVYHHIFPNVYHTSLSQSPQKLHSKSRIANQKWAWDLRVYANTLILIAHKINQNASIY